MIKAFCERLEFESVWQLFSVTLFLSYLLLLSSSAPQRFRVSRGVDLTRSIFPTKCSFAVFGILETLLFMPKNANRDLAVVKQQF